MSLAWAAASVIGVAAACVALLWLARRSPWNERFAREVREHDEAFEFLGVAYAVLLAFVVISAYTSYNDAKSGAETEAEAILQLSRTVEAEEIERLEGLLVCYGRAVIHDAWPAMRGGDRQSARQRLGEPVPTSGVRNPRPKRSSNGRRSGSCSSNRTSESRAAARGLPRPSAPCPSPCGSSCCWEPS